MRRPSFLFPVAIPFAASLTVFWACSSNPDDGAPTPPSPDAATDALVSPEHEPDPLAPSCTTIDMTPGTGPRFCDLPGSDTTDLTVPPEFCAREFTTSKVGVARVLRFAPNGDLFVSAPAMLTAGGASGGPGSIVVLPDDDHDGRADAVLNFAGAFPHESNESCAQLEGNPANLSCVHGLFFSGGYLYYTRSDEVRRFPYAPGARTAGTNASELVATLGGKGAPEMRWTHTLEQPKDGSLYVSRGRFDSSSCSLDEMTKGAVLTLHIEGKAALPLTPEVRASGFRNPMYLRCAPNSCGDCYASELNGDAWDSVGGREKIALLDKQDESWGYPCCVERGKNAPGWDMQQNCATVGREVVAIPLHDTPFGLDFDRGGFPEPYKHGAFVALHGVITSYGGTGVLFMKADPRSLRPTGETTLFAKGFRGTGRATDVTFAPDGRMFIADDTAGKIYWIAPRTLAGPAPK